MKDTVSKPALVEFEFVPGDFDPIYDPNQVLTNGAVHGHPVQLQQQMNSVHY